MTRKVLIVAYNFPPVGGVSGQRPAKFAKYLSDYDWEPIVLTVANPSVPMIDNSLTEEISFVKIYKAATIEPSYGMKSKFKKNGSPNNTSIKSILKSVISYFMLPDLQILWWPGLIGSLLKILVKEKPACVLVTAPPFSTFFPVVFICSLFKVPVVIDYRDEWSYSRKQWENTNKSRIADLSDSLFEKYAVSKSSAILAVNHSYIKSLIAAYPKIEHKKCYVITNGYDDSDFYIEKKGKDNVSHDDGKVIFLYTGTVWNGNTLKQFVTALRKVITLLPEAGKLIKFKIYGRILPTEEEYLSHNDLADIIDIHGFVEHKIVVQEMMNSDILVISINDLPGADKIIVGKTFEYMATGKHILAVVPEGETQDIISRHYGNASFANPTDVNGLSSVILDLIRNIEIIRNQKGNNVSLFTRKNLTKQLAELLGNISNR